MLNTGKYLRMKVGIADFSKNFSLTMRYLLLLFLFLATATFAQKSPSKDVALRTPEKVWVDSIYNRMTFDERVGQLFMVAAYSNKDSAHVNSIDRLIKNYKIGGLIFFQGGPQRQAKLTNRFQAASKTPLFIGIDAEWGLAMRLDSVPRFPWNMTLGAIQDMKMIEKVGRDYGKQSRRMGVHFNFAPVLDINTNPKNPIIGNRSFGEDKIQVTNRALALMKGIQRQGVFATGKHFPGHGDTSTDSHHTLPTVTFSASRLNDVEFAPYKRLFKEDLASVMVAHLNVPALEPRDNYPSSLSYNIVTNVLKKQLGFEGLIFTDALNMKGASNFKQPGDIDLEAFLAGNDVLLFAENVPWALEKICVAYQDTLITEERLSYSVKKILKYKYKAGLDRYKPIEMQDLHMDLNSAEDAAFQYTLYENATTVLKNDNWTLPIQNLEKENIAYVKLGDDSNSTFVNTIQNYAAVTEIIEPDVDSLLLRLKPFTKVIVGFHKSDGAWKNHEFKSGELQKLDSIAKYKDVILDVFAKPYSILPVKSIAKIKAVVISYQNTDVSQAVSGSLLFGAFSSKGKLPVSLAPHFKVGDGFLTRKVNVLGVTAPENVDMDSRILTNIDVIANKAILDKTTPGIQVLVARKGQVIYQKSFGYHTYDKLTKVKNSDIYDVASLTKITATLPLTMQLFDENKLSMDSKLGEMLPLFKNTDKKNIDFKELLSHQAGLQAWVPFYKATLDAQNQPLESIYSKTLRNGFTSQVSENLYIQDSYRNKILAEIAASKLSKREYKYSDFTFIILKEYIEKQLGKPLDQLSQDRFFAPMGMSSTMFNPLRKFDMSRIPPTEVDTYFRHATIQGYVHDMEAAMEGGVGGHAGLFSNSIDMAKLMQMYLQRGQYGNRQYISGKTIEEFNECYFCKTGNRRGLGFDKPQLAGKAGPTCDCVSERSFGHTGFTGTMAWADPETEIIYIFLSNRTFPDSAENKLSKENIRENIQKVIQEAIIN